MQWLVWIKYCTLQWEKSVCLSVMKSQSSSRVSIYVATTTTCASASLVLKEIKTSTFPKSLSRLKSLLYCSSKLEWLVRHSFYFGLALTYRGMHRFDINVMTIFEQIHFRTYVYKYIRIWDIHTAGVGCLIHTAIPLFFRFHNKHNRNHLWKKLNENPSIIYVLQN